MRNKSWAVLVLAMAVAVGFAGAGPAAAEEPEEKSGRHVLDEYNIDVFGTGDSMRVALGASWGDVYPSGFYWNRGFRLTWLEYQDDHLPKTSGYGAGASFAFGWGPERVVSPLSTLTVTFPVDISDRVRYELDVSLGARVRLTTSESEQFAVTFSLYRQGIAGAGFVPDANHTGLAVFFSSAFYGKK